MRRLAYKRCMSHLKPSGTLAGGDNTAVAERIERLLRVPAAMGLATRAQCLEYLGGLFRPTLGTPAHHTDMQVSLGASP